MNKYFGDKKFYKKVLTVAIPIAVQNGITNFVNMLDNIMVGRLGTDPISGVAIVNQLMFVFNLCVFGALSGIGIFTAQYYGKGDQLGVRRTFRMQIVTGLIVIAFAFFMVINFGDSLIKHFLTQDNGGGTVEGTMLFGHTYMLYMMIGIIPFVVVQIYANTLRNTGETFIPMLAGIIAVVINLAGNYLLIYGKFGFPKLGVKGAAIATVSSRCVELLIVVLWTHIHAHKNEFIIGAYRNIFDVPFDMVKTIVPKAFPLLLNETLWAAGQAMLVRTYSIRGLSSVTAINIANTIANLFNVVFIAMGCATAIIIGQLLGAGKIEKAKADATRLAVFSVLLCFVTGALLFVCAPFFPLIYNTSDKIRQLAKYLIMAQAVYSPLYAYTNASYFTLRSGGRTWVTFAFDSIFVWLIVIPIALLLTHFTDFPIWIMYILVQATEVPKCLLGYFMVRSGKWAVNLTKII